MALSMTGFGNSTISTEKIYIKCEILCLNKKNLEIYINFPKFCFFSELHLRKIIEKELERGKITVNFDVNIASGMKKVVLDESLFNSWNNALIKLAKKYDLKEDLSISDWLMTDNIWRVEDVKLNRDELLKLLEQCMLQTVQKVKSMRKAEGKQITNDIKDKINQIEQQIKEISKQAPVILNNYKQKIEQQVSRSNEFNPKETDLFNRFISIFTEKVDVSEEITRLSSHLLQFKNFLRSNSPAGRSLDFLLQEILREVNTIGSKIQDLLISQNVVKIKTLVEQIREQSQNIL